MMNRSVKSGIIQIETKPGGTLLFGFLSSILIFVQLGDLLPQWL